MGLIELAKEFEMSPKVLKRDLKLLYENIIKKASNKGGAFLPDDLSQLNIVRDKMKEIPDVSFRRDAVKSLVFDAYRGDPNKLSEVLNKVDNYYILQSKIPSKYQNIFSGQLDHIIPMSFLKQVDEGDNPLNLIRVQPVPTIINQKSFKGNFDAALSKAKRTGDTEAIKAFNELQKYLPQEFGGISKSGKVSDFVVDPLDQTRSLTDQQKKFGEIYERVFKFIDNPKVGPLLEKVGINPQTAFKVLRGSSQLMRKNLPGFLNTFEDILKKNPELRVEFGDEFADIKNQYAALDTGTMSDVSPVKKETEEPGLPAEAIGAGTLFGMKYAPQIARGVGNTVRAVGSPLTGLTLAATELASDDPSLGTAGAEIVFTDQIRKAAGQVPKGIMSNVFGLQGLSKFGKLGTALATRIPRAMTPVGLTLLGAEGIKKLYDEEQKKNRMIEAMDPEERLQFLEEEKATEELMSRASAAYGGRMGFADGPEDPKKRKFMKIMGGLASIPLLGRFIDIGTQAPKVAEVLRRGADGIPDFIMDLIAKVKAKAEAAGMKYFTGNRADEFADVYQADDFVVTEQGNKITLKKRKQEGDMLEKDIEMEIETDPETGGITYKEATARPDAEGKLKDVEEYIDEIDLEDMKKYTYDE